MGQGTQKINNHISGFKEEVQKASQQEIGTFFNWFDESGGDIDTNFLKGQCEFSFYILMSLMEVLKDMKRKTCLEIGYVGGRLLALPYPYSKKLLAWTFTITLQRLRRN